MNVRQTYKGDYLSMESLTHFMESLKTLELNSFIERITVNWIF